MIYVTHDQTEALTFADQVVVMDEGAVVQMGTPADLFERPAHTFVGYFIGSPGMNVLRARSRATRPSSAAPRCRSAAATAAQPGKVEIGMRPEYARLAGRRGGLPVAIRRVEDRRPAQDRPRRALRAGRSTLVARGRRRSRPT